MKSMAVLLALLLALPFLSSCGGVSQQDYDTLLSKYEGLEAEHHELVQELAELKENPSSAPVVMPALPVEYRFGTDEVATIRFILGKGDLFAARININRPCIFWVSDPWYFHIVDPGTISGVYEFTFTAEKSGDYRMTFQDDRELCWVTLQTNFEGKLWLLR